MLRKHVDSASLASAQSRLCQRPPPPRQTSSQAKTQETKVGFENSPEFNAIPIKLPMAYFTGLGQIFQKNVYGISQKGCNNLEKKQKLVKSKDVILNYTTKHCNQTAWYWYKYKYIGQWREQRTQKYTHAALDN